MTRVTLRRDVKIVWVRRHFFSFINLAELALIVTRKPRFPSGDHFRSKNCQTDWILAFFAHKTFFLATNFSLKVIHDFSFNFSIFVHCSVRFIASCPVHNFFKLSVEKIDLFHSFFLRCYQLLQFVALKPLFVAFIQSKQLSNKSFNTLSIIKSYTLFKNYRKVKIWYFSWNVDQIIDLFGSVKSSSSDILYWFPILNWLC